MRVGLKLWAIVALALVAISTFIGTTLYIRSAEEDKIVKEILQDEVDTRQRIDESIRGTRYNSPEQSLDRLRDRQSSN
jgi:hypothetical protein